MHQQMPVLVGAPEARRASRSCCTADERCGGAVLVSALRQGLGGPRRPILVRLREPVATDRRQGRAVGKVGRYVAGYALGGKGKLPLERAVRDPRLPARTLHINRRLTADSKATMRNARLNRRLDAAFKGLCKWPRLTDEELLAALWFRFRSIAVEPGSRSRFGARSTAA